MKHTILVKSISKILLSLISNKNLTVWQELMLNIAKKVTIKAIPVSSLLTHVHERMQAASSEKEVLKDLINLQWSIFSHHQGQALNKEARALLLGKEPKLMKLEMQISVKSKTKSSNLISSRKLIAPILQVLQAKGGDHQTRKAGKRRNGEARSRLKDRLPRKIFVLMCVCRPLSVNTYLFYNTWNNPEGKNTKNWQDVQFLSCWSTRLS